MKRALQQLVAVAAVAVCVAPAAAQPTQMIHLYNSTPEDVKTPSVRTYFTATSAREDDIEAFRQRLLAAGARNVNWFAPDVIICDMPVDKDASSLQAAPGIVQRTEAEAASGSGDLAEVVRAYDLAAAMKDRRENGRSMAMPDDGFRDVVFEPTPERLRAIRKQLADMPLSTAAGPGQVQKAINQNSEILTGSIKVYLILPESNGVIDPKSETWKKPDGTENQDYLDARTNAFAVLLDWQSQFPNMGISFTMIAQMVECDYEPITHNSKDDALWIVNSLRRLEPDVAEVEDALAACHVFNERRKGGYDWIFTGFVGHSRNEPNHRFRGADYTAYAWLGGPLNVTPYPGGLDPNNIGENLVFSKVWQHESSHIFWTLDEYPGAPGTCGSTSGYLNYSNQNVNMQGPNGITRCITEIDCIMDTASREDVGRPYCKWSLGHMGVIDNNGNAIPDVFEKAPTISFATADKETVETDDFTAELTVTSQAVPSQNHAFDSDIRIDYASPLREAQFSIGGGWVALSAADGKWDGMVEHTSVAIQSLPPGLTELLFRARNNVGMWSDTYALKIYFVGVNYTGLSASPADGRINVRWEVVGEAFGAKFDLYRVDPGVEIPDLRFLDPSEPLPGVRLAEEVPPSSTANGFTTYRYADTDVTPGVKYRYFVNGFGEVTTPAGTRPFRTPSHVIGETAMVPVPSGAVISRAAPNPFRNDVKFSLSVPRTVVQVQAGSGSFESRAATHVDVAIYDVLGRRVKSILARDELRDVLTLSWDGSDQNNRLVPSGIYFIRAVAGTESAVEKVLLIR